ncbi:MAG: hypothetical protein RLZ25_183 [Pseudomonadota bacterium]|jgi:hypothetical protein
MDQVEFGLMMEEGESPQPGKKRIPVRRSQNLGKGVSMFCSGNAFGYSEKVEVMVPQNTDCRITQRSDEPQRFERLRPAIDQVTGEPKSIPRGVKF